MIASIYQSVRERATPESLMLLLVLVVSSYMVLEAQSFSREVALFPQFAAVVTICGVLLLLTQPYLPETLQETITDSSTMFEQTTESIQEVEEDAQSRTDQPEPSDDHQEQYYQLLLVGLLAVYGVLGYTFGLVLATPVFLLLYVILFDVPRIVAVGLIVAGIVIALSFNAILPVNLMEGQLW